MRLANKLPLQRLRHRDRSGSNKEWLSTVMEESLKRAHAAGMNEDEAADVVAQSIVDGLVAGFPFLHRALEKSAPRMLAEHKRIRLGFERHLDRVWGTALDRYYITHVVCLEAGENHRNTVGQAAATEQDLKIEALTRIHARACLVSSEVHALLRTGHAAGAEARWRTLHELAVVSSLIADADPELAERFLLHVDIAASKSARSYERHCNALGLDPIDPADLQRLETRRRALIARFGKIYDEDWGWASPLVPAKTVGISFSDLERVAGFDHLRPYYLLGCHRVHGGSMGVELGLLDFRGQSTLLVGPSNDGLTDAGHGSLISLSNVTISLLRQRIEENPLNLMTMQTILRLVDLAGDAFAETQAELTNREREIESAAQAGSVLDPG